MPDYGFGFGRDPFGGGYGSPFLPDLGPGGDGSGGTGNPWVDLGRDILEDIGVFDWLRDRISPGSGGGGGGYGYTGGNTGVNLGNAYGSDEKREAILKIADKSPSLKQRFGAFLRAVGAYGPLVAELMTASILSWPGILQDLYLLWMSRNTPTDGLSADGQVVAGEIPNELLDPGNGGGNGTFLPSPIGIPGFGNMGGYLPPAMEAYATTVYRAPKGYVTVTDPSSGQKLFVLKSIARSMGLYKPRAKAPITGRQYKAVRAAGRWEKKLAGMLKDSCNFSVTKKTARRRTTKRSC